MKSGDLFARHLRPVAGTHAIQEALNLHPNWVDSIWIEQGRETQLEIKKIQQDYKKFLKKVEIKPSAILEKVCSSHQGAILFMAETPKVEWEQLFNKKTSRVILLDGIEDPHNLGAILRTSWLSQVDLMLLPQDRAARLSATVHKVACGGVEHVPVEICVNFSQVLQNLKNHDYWIFGLSHQAKSTLFDLKIPEKVVWCIGSEDKGLRSTTAKLCDELVRIPQANSHASYNASVAAGMSLLETFRQQALTGK